MCILEKGKKKFFFSSFVLKGMLLTTFSCNEGFEKSNSSSSENSEANEKYTEQLPCVS